MMIVDNSNKALWIEKKLTEALRPTTLEVIDQGWQHVGHQEEGAGHFRVIIASPQFDNLDMVACHRLVYDALEGAVGNTIHALQIEIKP